jgi:CubicO group peptidase (beta-lactamase class C family)
MSIIVAGDAKVNANPSNDTVDDAEFHDVSSLIQGWVDKGYYSGASIIVGTGDKVLFERMYGANQPDTVTFVASASKWLSAATIASVVDDGKLSWDDHVSKWIPELGPALGSATIRQLLSHTSGYPTGQPAGRRHDDYQTLSESVKNIGLLPLASAPGTHFRYGALPMQVAGRIAEIATGKDWEALFHERIAQPLGMTATRFTPVDPGRGNNPMLGGAARTTLQDYARFLQMIGADGVFHGKRILSGAAIREMQADQVRGAQVMPGTEYVEKAYGHTYNGIYGLGEWRDEVDANGDATLISSPSWAGALPWIDKTRHLYGFFLAHVDASPGSPMTRDNFSGFWASAVLPLMVRQAVDKLGTNRGD